MIMNSSQQREQTVTILLYRARAKHHKRVFSTTWMQRFLLGYTGRVGRGEMWERGLSVP